MHQLEKVLAALLPDEPERVAPLFASNNQLFKVEMEDGRAYALKCFESDRRHAYEKEVAVRQILQRDGRLRYAQILGAREAGDRRYLLMEFLSGENLLDRWRRRPELAVREGGRLGELLATLHTVPLAGELEQLLAGDDLYSDAYLEWMLERAAGFTGAEQIAALRRCHQRISNAGYSGVLIHGDFGPHQIIVDGDGGWSVVDFEYAAIGSFADDLAGAELRLEQQAFPVAGFLQGYMALRPLELEYGPLRLAYKAVTLLAILTYRLARLGEAPPAPDQARLRRYLQEV